MTYCAGVSVDRGLVFISDSRTNAGVDNIGSYSKMISYGVPGERQFVLCSAGNLATTQAVTLEIERDIDNAAEVSLLNIKRMSDAAAYIGELSVAAQKKYTGGGPVFEASFILGGEIDGARCRAFMIYPEGNFVSCSNQTPFLQIGEAKYGKPILDRMITHSSSLEDAAVAALLSMDATTRSNLTVGPPIELTIYEQGSLQPGRYVCFGEESRYLRELRLAWNTALRDAITKLPPIDWAESI